MILVLGSTGFIGRNVVKQLSKTHPGQVRAMVRPEKTSSGGKSSKRAAIKDLPGIEIVEGDVTDLASLRKATQGVDTVINLAQATANFKNVNNLYWRVNVEGTRNSVEAAKEAGVKLYILGSGLGTVQGEPGSYMRTRWEAEEAVRKSGIDYVIIQPSIIFGKGSEFFEAQARIMSMLPVAAVIGTGKTRFQPIYVEDVARIFVETLSRPDKIGRTFAVGGPEYFTYKELINIILRTIGKRRIRMPLPLWAARINATMFNLLPNPPLTPATVDLFDFDNITSDPQVVEHEYGFKPMGLMDYLGKEGISYKKR